LGYKPGIATPEPGSRKRNPDTEKRSQEESQGWKEKLTPEKTNKKIKNGGFEAKLPQESAHIGRFKWHSIWQIK